MALVRDTGATSFPAVTGTGGAGSSGVAVTSTLISTNAAAGRLVAVVVVGNFNDANMGATTFGGNTPLTWTKRAEANGSGGGNANVVQVWNADFSSQITNALFSATWTAATTNYQTVIAIDALTGASTGTGASGTVIVNGAAVPAYASVTGVLSGSITYVGVFHESPNTALTPTGTTEVADLWSGAGVGAAAGYSTLTGTFRLGWTENIDFGGIAAYEVQAGPDGVTVVLPSIGAQGALGGVVARGGSTGTNGAFQADAFQNDAFLVSQATGGVTVVLQPMSGKGALSAPTVAGGASLTAPSLSAKGLLSGLSAAGGSTVPAPSLSARGQMSAPTVIGGAAVGATALQAKGVLSQPSVFGGASVPLGALQARGMMGTTPVAGGASVGLQSLGAQGLLSGLDVTITGGGSVSVTLSPMSGRGQMSAATVVGGSSLQLSSMDAQGRLQPVTVTGGSSVSLSGLLGQGRMGTVTVTIGAVGVVVALDPMSARGQMSAPTVTGAAAFVLAQMLARGQMSEVVVSSFVPVPPSSVRGWAVGGMRGAASSEGNRSGVSDGKPSAGTNSIGERVGADTSAPRTGGQTR